MILAIPVTTGGSVQPGWGRVSRLALVTVTDGAVTAWEDVDVAWDRLHDEGTEGSHHARVVRFLRGRGVTHVVVTGMGDGMRNTLTKLGVSILPARWPSAPAAVQAALAEIAGQPAADGPTA